jgi:6-phosphogluconolactonase
LAAEVAGQLLGALGQAVLARGRAVLGLTAGSIMEQVWAALASAESDLDWSKVDVIWGDERFVQEGTSDRNDAPANRDLFDHAPFSFARRFSMPASGGEFGEDLDAAALGYSRTFAQVGPADVMLLGIGPDGHCCSLFPHHPGLEATGTAVIAVRESPKPPPLRISLSYEGLNASREIWVVASGEGAAVGRAQGGADRSEVPSAAAQGTLRTVWFLDADAAAELD